MTTSLPKNSPDQTGTANSAPVALRDAFAATTGTMAADRAKIPDHVERDFARMLGDTDVSSVTPTCQAVCAKEDLLPSVGGEIECFSIRETSAGGASRRVDEIAEVEAGTDLPNRSEIEGALALLMSLWQQVAPQAATELTLSLEQPIGSGSGQLSLSPQMLAALKQELSAQGASLQAAEISAKLLRELTLPEGAADTELTRQLATVGEPVRLLDSALKPNQPPGVQLTASRAEVMLSGGAVLSVESSTLIGSGASLLPASAPLRENTAAAKDFGANSQNAGNGAQEKNFLKTEGKTVKTGSVLTGISGARLPAAMTTAPSALPITAFAVAPVAALTERLSAGPVPAPATSADTARMIAHRAVETVLNVVETQAASRLQPVPSVQLRFKFGNDDLAVRVEMRNGEVRTEFRSDSPELRAAIAQEWRAISGRSETTLRFAEPVVTNSGNANTHTGSNSAFSQGNPSSQQHARAAQPEFFAGIGRAFPTPAPSTEPAAPVMRPTSKRLSAVA